ncbi:RNA polymerase sigma factor [Paenibacillus gorillae]|uniref:RNA polymerase sigma factor n=1 Tax=Paenibacillus gorillae TaxID=1243662 RepID=UPI0004B2A6C8|nr:RNA polymerase sigma factor [Paenibacillus gorillae]
MDWKTLIAKYSANIAGNRWDAEDLSQEAWLKLTEAIRKEPQRIITKAYVYRVIKHAWIDRQRKNKLRTLPLVQQGDQEVQGERDPELSTLELLELLAGRLAPRMGVIFLLMDIFDFTAKETAAYVRMKESTVQVTLGRARARLKMLAEQHSDLQEPEREREKNARKTFDGGASIRIDALVEAFRKRDPEAICRAYIGVNETGLRLSRLQRIGTGLQFLFRDPDGNEFSVIAREVN